MGKNKMLLELDGESLIRRAAKRALAAGLSPLVVVVGHEAGRLRAELKDLPLVFAVNPPEASVYVNGVPMGFC